MSKLDARARVAVTAASVAGRLSRLLGRGSGGMIGGRVAQLIDPNILKKAARGKQIVLVTGTNGKSTTTAMVKAALESTGHKVASNVRGDNMTHGILVGLLDTPDATYAALEVDELYLGSVADAVEPAAFVLLNLSRDQLDRVGEITRVERHIRDAVNRHPDAHVVANCDDPLVASAAWDAPTVSWVAGGGAWTLDSLAFPRGGGLVNRTDETWSVNDGEYTRPEPNWTVEDDRLVRRGHDDGGNAERGQWPLHVNLPGAVNRTNAAHAVAAAVALGADPALATRATGAVTNVAGRYSTVTIGGRNLHLLLAKNPAGWKEALEMLDTSAPTLILIVNGQIPDGTDLSWLWDIGFEALAGASARILITGERRADLAVRLLYAGIDCELVDTPQLAIETAAQGHVEILANYTAFRDLTAWLRKEGHGGQ